MARSKETECQNAGDLRDKPVPPKLSQEYMSGEIDLMKPYEKYGSVEAFRAASQG